MPPEIGLIALVVSVFSFVLSMRTRRDLMGGGRSRHPLFGQRDASDPALDRLTRTLDRMEASEHDLAQRLENLETIVTSEAGRTGTPLVAIPPAEPSAAEDAERLARRLRG